MTDWAGLATAMQVPNPNAGLMIDGQAMTCGGPAIKVHSPIDGAELATIAAATGEDLDTAIAAAASAFTTWRCVPPPVRGELVRRFGDILRQNKDVLADLVTLEAGKIRAEALGEVQEMIDICDFATGLSRQLYGLTIATERPDHRMMEQWHPLGPVGIISAFNFPVAVWAWNAAIALVCGNTLVWKPSEKTPLTALACQALLTQATVALEAPAGLSSVVTGGRDVGAAMSADRRIPLISATGSVAMGRSVAQTVAARLGRSLLELGGNNASIVTRSADLELAVRGIAFGAVGTCGQRCTTLRRLFVHHDVADDLVARLKSAWASIPVGDPRDAATLVGPLIDRTAFEQMQAALVAAAEQGGLVSGGEPVSAEVPANGQYVRPAIVEMPSQTDIMHQETFAPILYVVRYGSLEEAIAMQNAVQQGLSSSIFTTDLREAELFLSASGSDLTRISQCAVKGFSYPAGANPARQLVAPVVSTWGGSRR
jgi:aldehyde dehydrogenase (NAD+)